MEKEYRKLEQNINQITDNRTIEGYACKFNSLSENLGGFYETIDSNALDGVIETSDVFALINHDKERGILARSKKGVGTLILTIDEIGLKYKFEAPKTALGDEALEMVKRGDIDSSSFAFKVSKDSWVKQTDGTYIRTINQIVNVSDISLVYQPAYEETSVTCKRFLEVQESDKELIPTDEPVNEDAPVDKPVEECKSMETEQPSETETECNTEPTECEKTDVNVTVEIETGECEPECETDPEAEQPTEERNNKNIDEPTVKDEAVEIEKRNINNKENKKIKMENFKLITAINNVVNNRSLSEIEQEVVNIGKSEMRKSGLEFSGQIQLPTEKRDITATGAGLGLENVSEQKLNILEPLYADLVLAKAGAQFLTGLVGDVSIPTYSGSAVLWKGETAAAADGAGSFGEVVLKPKRLTATIDVSKQFLLQDSNSAEAMLMRDITTAISEKLEATILGNSTGADQPDGLFLGVTGTTAATYTGLTAMEATLENKNVKNYVAIVNPTAKQTFKGVKINEGRMVFEDAAIDGIATYTSSNVYAKGLILGDFSDYVIGQWGSIDLIVDPYTQAANGKVRLVINAYFDAKPRRDSFVKAVLA